MTPKLRVVPREPVAHLRVAGKEQHFAAGGELDGQGEAGVVGVAVELEGEVVGRREPAVVDPPPGEPASATRLLRRR